MQTNRWVVALAVFALSMSSADASIVDFLLGEQDFIDGQAPILASETLAAGRGEPFPFHGSLFGDDRNVGALGIFSYTHLAPVDFASILSATLTVGLIDHDSVAGNDTIDFFFDGIQQDDSAFIGISTLPSSASVVTVPVDVALLADGELVVRFEATGTAATSSGNSISPDFSLLSIQTIPEPGAVLIFGSGAWAWASNRRSRASRGA